MSHSHVHDGSGHDHSHAPTVTGANERKILISFVLIFSFMIVEVVGGLISGSLALLADAGHMLTDAAALALAYTAFRLGRRIADNRRTFGYLRLEVLAGFLNAVTLFGIVVWIVYEAIQRLQTPGEILAGPMMLVAVAGLAVNILVLWIMTRGETEHVNVKGAILHVMGDLLGSVGAIAAALIISATGWTPIDPILSVLVAVLILRSAYGLLTKSIHILLEGAPENAEPAAIERELRAAVPDLANVHHIHVWSITSGRAMATLNVRPTEDSKAPQVAHQVEQLLKDRFAVEHVTVAIDWNGAPAGVCSLDREIDAKDDGHSHVPGDGHSHGPGEDDGHVHAPGEKHSHAPGEKHTH